MLFIKYSYVYGYVSIALKYMSKELCCARNERHTFFSDWHLMNNINIINLILFVYSQMNEAVILVDCTEVRTTKTLLKSV